MLPDDVPIGARPTSRKRAMRLRARLLVRRAMFRVRGWTDLDRLERAGLRVGEHVFVGPDCHLDPAFCHLITLDDEATLSVRVTVLAHDASTRAFIGYTRLAPVHIGKRVFVGAGAIILPGVTIGDEAIVGAGSVVTSDVAARTIVVGNPARPIGDHAAYLSKHREALGGRPRWPVQGWTATAGISPARQLEVRRALEDGEGYVR